MAWLRVCVAVSVFLACAQTSCAGCNLREKVEAVQAVSSWLSCSGLTASQVAQAAVVLQECTSIDDGTSIDDSACVEELFELIDSFGDDEVSDSNPTHLCECNAELDDISDDCLEDANPTVAELLPLLEAACARFEAGCQQLVGFADACINRTQSAADLCPDGERPRPDGDDVDRLDPMCQTAAVVVVHLNSTWLNSCEDELDDRTMSAIEAFRRACDDASTGDDQGGATDDAGGATDDAGGATDDAGGATDDAGGGGGIEGGTNRVHRHSSTTNSGAVGGVLTFAGLCAAFLMLGLCAYKSKWLNRKVPAPDDGKGAVELGVTNTSEMEGFDNFSQLHDLDRGEQNGYVLTRTDDDTVVL